MRYSCHKNTVANPVKEREAFAPPFGEGDTTGISRPRQALKAITKSGREKTAFVKPYSEMTALNHPVIEHIGARLYQALGAVAAKTYILEGPADRCSLASMRVEGGVSLGTLLQFEYIGPSHTNSSFDIDAWLNGVNRDGKPKPIVGLEEIIGAALFLVDLDALGVGLANVFCVEEDEIIRVVKIDTGSVYLKSLPGYIFEFDEDLVSGTILNISLMERNIYSLVNLDEWNSRLDFFLRCMTPKQKLRALQGVAELTDERIESIVKDPRYSRLLPEADWQERISNELKKRRERFTVFYEKVSKATYQKSKGHPFQPQIDAMRTRHKLRREGNQRDLSYKDTKYLIDTYFKQIRRPLGQHIIPELLKRDLDNESLSEDDRIHIAIIFEREGHLDKAIKTLSKLSAQKNPNDIFDLHYKYLDNTSLFAEIILKITQDPANASKLSYNNILMLRILRIQAGKAIEGPPIQTPKGTILTQSEVQRLVGKYELFYSRYHPWSTEEREAIANALEENTIPEGLGRDTHYCLGLIFERHEKLGLAATYYAKYVEPLNSITGIIQNFDQYDGTELRKSLANRLIRILDKGPQPYAPGECFKVGYLFECGNQPILAERYYLRYAYGMNIIYLNGKEAFNDKKHSKYCRQQFAKRLLLRFGPIVKEWISLFGSQEIVDKACLNSILMEWVFLLPLDHSEQMTMLKKLSALSSKYYRPNEDHKRILVLSHLLLRDPHTKMMGIEHLKSIMQFSDDALSLLARTYTEKDDLLSLSVLLAKTNKQHPGYMASIDQGRQLRVLSHMSTDQKGSFGALCLLDETNVKDSWRLGIKLLEEYSSDSITKVSDDRLHECISTVIRESNMHLAEAASDHDRMAHCIMSIFKLARCFTLWQDYHSRSPSANAESFLYVVTLGFFQQNPNGKKIRDCGVNLLIRLVDLLSDRGLREKYADHVLEFLEWNKTRRLFDHPRNVVANPSGLTSAVSTINSLIEKLQGAAAQEAGAAAAGPA